MRVTQAETEEAILGSYLLHPCTLLPSAPPYSLSAPPVLPQCSLCALIAFPCSSVLTLAPLLLPLKANLLLFPNRSGNW